MIGPHVHMGPIKRHGKFENVCIGIIGRNAKKSQTKCTTCFGGPSMILHAHWKLFSKIEFCFWNTFVFLLPSETPTPPWFGKRPDFVRFSSWEPFPNRMPLFSSSSPEETELRITPIEYFLSSSKTGEKRWSRCQPLCRPWWGWHGGQSFIKSKWLTII